MKVVVLLYEDDPEKQKDDAVAGGGEGLDGVLDGGVALLAQVLEGVLLHRDAVGNYADDACKSLSALRYSAEQTSELRALAVFQ